MIPNHPRISPGRRSGHDADSPMTAAATVPRPRGRTHPAPPSPLDAAYVKQRAKALGADLVGIASAETLNAFPPDPRWPQTPESISPHCRSVIVIAQRIPAGAFRCKTNAPVQYIDMLVLRKMDKVAWRLAEELEAAGHPTFVTASQETEWNLKRASYGRLSTRHLGVEAGLGTLGLEVNILTPEFGPRVYLTGVLTELELEPDARITEQVCIGESCSRCLHSCPADAVLHWGIDKRGCATEAQEFGFATMLGMFDRLIDGKEDPAALFRSRDFFGFWQGLLRVVGSFGDCPRCLAVCPVGNDYHAHLADPQKTIPEKTPEKVALGKAYKAARVAHDSGEGAPLAGLSEWNRRWVGPEGYQGIVARQMQAFKRQQQERAEATDAAGHAAGGGEERS
jgi:epoxyqueuosine reductase QueG